MVNPGSSWDLTFPILVGPPYVTLEPLYPWSEEPKAIYIIVILSTVPVEFLMIVITFSSPLHSPTPLPPYIPSHTVTPSHTLTHGHTDFFSTGNYQLNFSLNAGLLSKRLGATITPYLHARAQGAVRVGTTMFANVELSGSVIESSLPLDLLQDFDSWPMVAR